MIDPNPPTSGADLPQRLLVVDDRVPRADKGTGDPRMARMLESIRRSFPGVAVTFVARDHEGGSEYAPLFEQQGIEVVFGQPLWAEWFGARTGMYDAVIVSRPPNFAWLRPLVDHTQPQARRAFDAESLFFRRLERTLPVADPLDRGEIARELDVQRALEVNAMGWADVLLAVSDDAAAVSRAIAPDTPIVLVRHAVAVPDEVPGFDDREGLVFFGGFGAGPGGPNEDAAVVAANDLFPRLHDELGAGLRIVGADPTPAVLALASDHVDVVGSVADPVEWLSAALVHISPLRIGAGLKLRFIDSMAAGLPFVTTSVGAEDLGLDDELASMIVSDDPDEQIDLAIRLYRDEALWSEASARLRALVAHDYSLERLDRAVIDVMVRLGFAPPPTCQS